MGPEHYVLSLTYQECIELHRALLTRAILEDELRREKGLEAIDTRPLLSRIEALLPPTETARLPHEVDDELWEYAWYSVTDEWAWYRALQEEKKVLGEKRFDSMNEKELRERIEKRYTRDFERFIAEIEMKDVRASSGPKKSRAKNA